MKFFVTTSIISLITSVFLLSNTQSVSAQVPAVCNTVAKDTCLCSANESRIISVLCDKCPTDTYGQCQGDPYKGTLTCGCIASDPGVNCGKVGMPAINNKCCETGSKIEPRSGICLPAPKVDDPFVFNLCNGLGDKEQTCIDCLGTDDTNRGVWTSFGCIKTNPKVFIGDFLKIALGIAGGIALLLMIYGAFLVSVSAGDPKKADEGKEIITGTIAGLLFIIFSVFLLKLIGVDILQIPGF